MSANNPSTSSQISPEVQSALEVFNKLSSADKDVFASKLPQRLDEDLIGKLINAANTARAGGQPASGVINYLWVIIITAFTAVFLFAAGGIGISALQTGKAPDVLITIFSTSVGFLAGVLTPSPSGSGNKSV
jgi:hypothetical protein